MYDSKDHLISGQHISQYSPESFREYVRSLKEQYYADKARRAAERPSTKKTGPLKDFTLKKTKTGKWSLIIRNRKPEPWITLEEINLLVTESEISERELWIVLGAKKGLMIQRDPSKYTVKVELV